MNTLHYNYLGGIGEGRAVIVTVIWMPEESHRAKGERKKGRACRYSMWKAGGADGWGKDAVAQQGREKNCEDAMAYVVQKLEVELLCCSQTGL